MPANVIEERLAFARSVDWDSGVCAVRWGVSREAVGFFRKRHAPDVKIKRGRNSRLSPAVILQRMEFAARYGYDTTICAEEWDIEPVCAAAFIRRHRGNVKFAKGSSVAKPVLRPPKPEYENQDLFDLHVLEADDYCAKYHVTKPTYYARCKSYKGVRDIPTPRIRRRWAAELEAKL